MRPITLALQLLSATAQLELTMILEVGKRGSSIPVRQQSKAVARVLARREFLAPVLERIPSEADINDLRLRMCAWAYLIQVSRQRKRTQRRRQ